MLYRIKIPRCLDIIVELNNIIEAERYSRKLNSMICKSDKIYIHALRRTDNELVEKEKIMIKA